MQETNEVGILIGQLIRMIRSVFDPSHDKERRASLGVPRDERILRLEKHLGIYGLDLADVHRLVGRVNNREADDNVRLSVLASAKRKN
jgi:hypothetical protein